MSTPPRVRGLVDRFQLAVKKYEHAKGDVKVLRKSELARAKLELLRAIAVIAGPSAQGEKP